METSGVLGFFLGVTIWTLHRDRRRHDRSGPERLAWAAAFLTLGGLWVSAVVVGLGLTLLLASSVWNWTLGAPPRTPRCSRRRGTVRVTAKHLEILPERTEGLGLTALGCE